MYLCDVCACFCCMIFFKKKTRNESFIRILSECELYVYTYYILIKYFYFNISFVDTKFLSV